ncbi:MAG: hypothetical protein WBK77_01290, partial [Alphaproteobacteria bacterium]
MSEQSAIKQILSDEIQPQDITESLKADLRAERTSELRKKISGISGLKITSVSQKPQNHEVPKEMDTFDLEEESVLILKPAARVSMAATSPMLKGLYAGGAALTFLWVSYCVIYLFKSGVHYQPHELGGVFSGILAPPALLWIILSVMHRRADIHQYSQALRTELQSLLFPSEETGRLINKDIERLCSQAAEISSASKTVLKSLQRARQGLRVEMRDFTGISKKAEHHIDRLAESLKEKTAGLVKITEEIETRTGELDKKVQSGADAWSIATKTILDRAGDMEATLEKGAQKILDASDKAGDRTKDIEANLSKGFDGLNDVVSSVEERLKALGGQFETHTSGLSDVVAKVGEETANLTSLMTGGVESLEQATDRAVEAITRSTETIREIKKEL